MEILVGGSSMLRVPGGRGVSGGLCWGEQLECLCWRVAFGVSVVGGNGSRVRVGDSVWGIPCLLLMACLILEMGFRSSCVPVNSVYSY